MLRTSRRWVFRSLVSTAVGLCLGSCALPGRLYEVAPEIRGTLRGADAGLVVERTVRHRETADLHGSQRVAVAASGAFRFPALALPVAGREFSKVYHHVLRVRSGAGDAGPDEHLLWHATFARGDANGPIELDCDRARPVQHGQPCQIRNAVDQAWLVAEGRTTFDKLCSDCHGAGGTAGRAASAPDLRRIAARRCGRFDRAEIAEWIEGRSIPAPHGSRTMPVWGERLSLEYARYAQGDALIAPRLDGLVTYLESIQTAPQAGEVPASCAP